MSNPDPRPSTRRFVVGIDGSPASHNALRWAVALAESESAEVAAVMAWNYPTALMLPLVGSPYVPADFMEQSAIAKLRATVAANEHGSVKIEQHAVMGAARNVLTELSQDRDLIVLGRTGDSRLKRMWLGSTASYCVSHAECPVVIVGNSTAPEGTITVAVDGSESSISALEWALGLGDGRDILAVYSHDEWELDDLPLDDELRQRLDNAGDATLEHAVAQAVERFGSGADRVKRQVRQGDARTTIIEQADPSSLLVLGAQGHSGLARWALGSLADYAVHHSPCTVAIWH